MTKTPAQYEILQRPVWDPAPGTACLWQCIKEMPLSMHRLSDRVLGSLHIAIVDGFIKPADCNLNESDLARSFSIRTLRAGSNLGRGLLTPDGKGVISIAAPRTRRGYMVLRGSGNATANLPIVRYNPAVFKETYPNWEQWRDELLFHQRSNGKLHVRTFESYPKISNDGTPLDWPQGLTRDRTLASEYHYRLNNLNPKTGLPKEVRRSSSQAQPIPSTPLNLTASSGPEDRKRKRPSVATRDLVVLPANPSKKQKNTVVEHVPVEPLDLPGLSKPATTPIEVHKAAIRAAFQDKSANRTELFWTLLPYITVAEVEELLVRSKGSAQAKHE
ncbi:hypothetical protein VE02_01057 [Pseudogymnoascus sp. 03VT05]|nr:hypothetical protein VE02_01057 [Pseudogymnoascus sp. 03VT05]